MFTKFVMVSILVMFLTSCGTETNLPSNAAAALTTSSPIAVNETLSLFQSIPLPNVEGRIDHFSIDINGQRLFVAALGNNTVEIIDLETGKVIHSISGLSEPQGVLYIPEFNRIYIANGGNGLCQIFDGSSFAEIGRVKLSGDADNIRYDGNTASVVVGYGDGGLDFINAASEKIVSSIKLDGHPESFQLESSGSKIFVNIPSVNQIAVVDRQQQKILTTWTVTDPADNFPMALDESRHRLFVGFRSPAKLNVYDTETGNLVASLDNVEDVDDVFYDAARKIIFTIGGEGYIDIFSQQDADHYQLMNRVQTVSGARTGFWVPELNRLYVAVPHRGTQQVEVQVYELQP